MKGLGQLRGAEHQADFGAYALRTGAAQGAFGQHFPVGNGAYAAQGGVQRVVFGGKSAHGDAVAAGERVIGEPVLHIAVAAADDLAELEAVGGGGGGGELVAEGEGERHALGERLLELVGQIGLEAAADGKLAAAGELGLGAGRVDAFCGRLKRNQQQKRQNEQCVFTAFE